MGEETPVTGVMRHGHGLDYSGVMVGVQWRVLLMGFLEKGGRNGMLVHSSPWGKQRRCAPDGTNWIATSLRSSQ
jgi:hypothetical protein